jgi:hypothetical protein
MKRLVTPEQIAFYKEWVMGRGNFNPADFGIKVAKEEFIDQMVDFFNGMYRDQWTIDEMLFHPREAARFCDEVRHQFGYYGTPDDIILRVIMNARKRSERGVTS